MLELDCEYRISSCAVCVTSCIDLGGLATQMSSSNVVKYVFIPPILINNICINLGYKTDVQSHSKSQASNEFPKTDHVGELDDDDDPYLN